MLVQPVGIWNKSLGTQIPVQEMLTKQSQHSCSFVKYTQFCIIKNVKVTVQFVMYHNRLLGIRIYFDFIATLNILKYLCY